MFTVLVTYRLRDGVDREAAHRLAREAAPRFQGVPGLQSKHFLYHGERGLGGGFYTWETREAAEGFHSEAWLDSMEERMGSRPQLTFFETAVRVDNAAMRIDEAA